MPCGWLPEKVVDMSSNNLLTPLERLARSRHAIVRHMSHDRHSAERAYVRDGAGGDAAINPSHTAVQTTWAVIKQATRAWWRNHPVHVALEVAEPMLGHYAKEHPIKVLGIAAGVGAATVVLRPWRLLSLGSLLSVFFTAGR